MSNKRSRSSYEDSARPSSQFAFFGTPLPDPVHKRDDGAYLPVWKQEVKDERGRKRLHGAFTGGWSAGYFNTVGSKEGWTPSTFVSSRKSRAAGDAATKSTQQRAEDYMDEEDLADAAEAQKVETSQAFAVFGAGSRTEPRGRDLMDLFKPTGDTMGHQLLRKMGWKDGQGIGPRIRRSARLDLDTTKQPEATYLFTPDDVPMVHLDRKAGQMGLGYRSRGKPDMPRRTHAPDDGDDNEDDEDEPFSDVHQHHTLPIDPVKTKGKKGPRDKNTPTKQGGIGMGILNDNGSDDEDPWELGPKIRYNREIGAEKNKTKKKKKKKATASGNPSLPSAPTFLSKTVRAGNNTKKCCHDGKPPLEGFIVSKLTESFASLFSKYAPPSVPAGWTSAKEASISTRSAEYQSTSDAARSSKLDVNSRAAILGEKALPGKSVFDFVSQSTRDQIAAASGRADLPPARGEMPKDQAPSAEDRMRMLWEKAPKLDASAASSALSRTSGGPYGHDEEKRRRYTRYLENMVKADQPLPARPAGVSDDEFVRELTEFYNCAKLFKPMSGFMASRFTTGKAQAAPPLGSEAATASPPQPEAKPSDPAEEAAKMGIFGHITRTVSDFHPSRLLCKRFNVKPPSHSQPTHDSQNGRRPEVEEEPALLASSSSLGPGYSWLGKTELGTLAASESLTERVSRAEAKSVPENVSESVPENVPEKNDVIEAAPAPEDVLRAIFGDSDSE